MLGITVTVVHDVSGSSFQKCVFYIISRKNGKAREFRIALRKGAQQMLRTDVFMLFFCDTETF